MTTPNQPPAPSGGDYKTDLLRDLQDPEYAATYIRAAMAEGEETLRLALRDFADSARERGSLERAEAPPTLPPKTVCAPLTMSAEREAEINDFAHTDWDTKLNRQWGQMLSDLKAELAATRERGCAARGATAGTAPTESAAVAKARLEEAKWWAAPEHNLSHEGTWQGVKCHCEGCQRIATLEAAARGPEEEK